MPSPPRLRAPDRRILAVLVLAALGAAGCVRVKAYQRQNLARPAMIEDRGAGEARFAQHQAGAREGADGGSGQAGGGCGCN